MYPVADQTFGLIHHKQQPELTQEQIYETLEEYYKDIILHSLRGGIPDSYICTWAPYSVASTKQFVSSTGLVSSKGLTLLLFRFLNVNFEQHSQIIQRAVHNHETLAVSFYPLPGGHYAIKHIFSMAE